MLNEDRGPNSTFNIRSPGRFIVKVSAYALFPSSAGRGERNSGVAICHGWAASDHFECDTHSKGGRALRIGIDVTSWSNRRGYGRFTRGVVRELVRVDREHEYSLFVDAASYEPSEFPHEARHVVVRTSASPSSAASHSGRRSLPDVFRMTHAVSREKLDLFFFPTVYTWFPVLNRCPIVVGVHDTIAEDFPEAIFPNGEGGRFWNWKSTLARHQADVIMTVSEHARRAIVRVFGHAPERIKVIDEAPEPVFRKLQPDEIDRTVLARHAVTNGDFLIYVGGINPHKNLPALVESMAADRGARSESTKLLIVGELDTERFTPGLTLLRARIASLGMQDDVIFAGRVPDIDLVHLLNAALALVLPSFAEGFGLPAVESAACGTPVIATRNSPLPELLGDGGIWIDPFNPEELREAIRKIVEDSDAQSAMGLIAQERVARLSWGASARQLQELLHEAGRR